MILSVNINVISIIKHPALWIGLFVILVAGVAIFMKLKKKTLEKAASIDTEDFGFAYDENQDIFYSTKDAWQRKFGYCRLYDEGAVAASMIIDCEPIYFEYGGRKWMIELWKGQYGAVTGCEVGVYTAQGPDLDIPGALDATFFKNTSNEDFLEMSLTLYRDNYPLFSRKDNHWWLTGFCLGLFSQPEQLMMRCTIRMKDEEMRKAFVAGLKEAGYDESEFKASGTTVFLVFNKPHMPQPLTRTEKTEKAVQEHNERLCETVTAVTEGLAGGLQKLETLKSDHKKIYDQLAQSLRAPKLYEGYGLIEKQLKKSKAGDHDGLPE